MRFFITLSYCGANYHGWQIQPHDDSVQQTVENALALLLRHPVSVTGAGRTDTAVNAMMMVAHFDAQADIATRLDDICHRLNGILPRDIAIHGIRPVHDNAHARFDATARTYKYFLHTAKSPFLHSSSYFCPHTIDFPLMNQAAASLLSHRDFTSFSKLHTDVKTNICVVTHAAWTQIDPTRWIFTITADRFLRNMVRAIVGTLLDVGRHKITLQQFEQIILQKNRCRAGTSMPGHALYLWDITYPY